MTALLLPGLGVATDWQIRRRSDPAANALADRHYPRRNPGVGQVGGNGRCLVLVTGDELAAWVTTWPAYPLDGLHAWRCSIFRNEGPELSSTLIRTAMAITADQFGHPPPDGWITYVRPDRIRSTNPGACFKHAGWTLDRGYQPDRRRRTLIRLRAAA